VKIYVSYRREDSAAQAGRLSDRLEVHFGSGSVFRDIRDIAPGDSFPVALEAEVSQCDVFLALIGPYWLHASNHEGRRRIDDPSDWLRVEIETALRLGKPIVPVLVDGASFPPAHAVPVSIRKLTQFQGRELIPDPHYSRSVDSLIQDLEELVSGGELPDQESKPVLVFVSHATADRAWAEREIIRPLKAAGIRPWYSKESIETSTQWEREILKGLESCDWFLLVVSPRSASSEWIKDELNWAVYNRPTRIVPVIMEPADFWSFHIRLARIQNVDFTRDTKAARQELLATFNRDA